MVFLSTAVSRVTDAWAKDTLEGGGYGAAGGPPLGFGQATGVPVPFFGAIGKKFFDQLLGVSWGGFIHGARSGFDCVGEGEEGGFGGLGFRTEVAEGRVVDGRNIVIAESEDFSPSASIFFLLEGALVKVPDESGTVVFANTFAEAAGKVMFPSEGNTVFDVGEDDEGAHGGGEVGVGIGVGGVEIFGEILGFLEFSNIVIEGHGATGAWVGGAGGAGGSFGEVTNENAVEVGSWGFEGEATKDGVVEAGEFEPGKIGGAVESGFEDRKECTNEDGAEKAESGGGKGFGEDEFASDGEVGASGENGGEKGDEADTSACAEKVGAAIEFLRKEDGGDTRNDGGDEVPTIGLEEKELSHAE